MCTTIVNGYYFQVKRRKTHDVINIIYKRSIF